MPTASHSWQANPPSGDAIAGLRLPDGSMHSVLCRDGKSFTTRRCVC
jgi:hypothetical protein